MNILKRSTLTKYLLTAAGVGTCFYLSLNLKDTNWKMATAGLLGQVTADILFHPIDLINTRTKYFYMEKLSTITIAKRIMRTTGLKGFYRGGTVTIMGSSFGGFVYFYFYKRIKEMMKKLLEKEPNMYFIAYSVSSVVSEIIVYTFYYPFDLIKTRILCGQYEYKNFFDGLYQIWDNKNKKQSIKNLYSGFLPSLLLSTSSITLTMFSFELSRDYYARKKNILSSEVGGLDYFKCALISGVLTSFSLNFLEVYTIQKMIHGDKYTFKTFIKPKHFLQSLYSGILARNLYCVFYTIVLFEVLRMYGNIYNVVL
jgi:hypothetical protein